MKLRFPFVVLTAALLAAPPAMAQRGINIQARTAGELADLCAANPKDAQGDAKINFCLGYGQGALSTELRTPEGKKTFCFPSPAPTRLATMTQFSEWVRALPDQSRCRRWMGSSASSPSDSRASRDAAR
jgi:Rap1a immunity proteins